MKKKILFLSALVAASTAFIGCSSDENLAEVPEVVEPVVEEPTPTASPFTFNVGMNNGTFTGNAPAAPQLGLDIEEITRAATVGDANPFTLDGAGFTLYGFQEPEKNGGEVIEGQEHGMFFEDGVPFTYDGSEWTASANWPSHADTGEEPNIVKHPLQDCYFYALSYAGKPTSTITSGGPTLIDPTGPTNNAVSFTYTLPFDEETTSAFNLNKQEDLLVASDLTGKKSGTVDLGFSHALANLEIKAILPSEGYTTDDGGKYDNAESPRIENNYFIYIKSITVHNLPASGDYTYGAETPWTPRSGKKDAVISWEKGIVIPAVPYSATITTPGNDGTPELKATRLAAEHALYKSIATGDASIMMIPHTATAASENFSSDEDNIYIEVNCFVGTVDNHADTGGDETAPLTDAEIAVIEGAIAYSQTGTTWFYDAENLTTTQEKWDEYCEAHASETNDNTMQIGINTDMMPDYTRPGFYCSSSDDEGQPTGTGSCYLKFNSNVTFKENKKYTLYLNLSNLLNDDGTNHISIVEG